MDMRQRAGGLHQTQQVGCYNRVIQALRKYPVPIIHPLQAMSLNGVGKNMLSHLFKMFKRKQIAFKYVKLPEKAKHHPAPDVAKTIKEHESELIKAGKDIDEEAQRLIESVPAAKTLGNLPYDIEWTLVLLQDSREREDEIKLENGRTETRNLAVGDFTWVLRLEYSHKGLLIRKEEYMLDYLVERKTSKDLLASNFSTHLNDQLSRMLKCKLPKLYLLLEGNFSCQEVLMSLQNQFGICILQCRSHAETLMWLKTFSAELMQQAPNLDFHQLRERTTYDSFTTMNRRTVQLREVFAEQLRQWPSVPASKVPEVLKVYPTFAKLSVQMQAKTQETVKMLQRLGLPLTAVEFIQGFILG